MSLLSYYTIDSDDWEFFQTKVEKVELAFSKKFSEIIYRVGRKKRPAIERFRSNDIMFIRIDSILSSIHKRNQEKKRKQQEKKEQAKIARSKVKVGDLFYTSWGYDQTNVSFFKVIERVSPAKAKIIEIGSFLEENQAYMSGTKTPNPEKEIGDSKICLINSFGNLSKADEYDHDAYPTTPEKSHYVSWYG